MAMVDITSPITRVQESSYLFPHAETCSLIFPLEGYHVSF